MLNMHAFFVILMCHQRCHRMLRPFLPASAFCCPNLPPPILALPASAAARSYHTSTRSYSSAAQPAAADEQQQLPPGPAKGSDVPRINIGVFGVMNAGKSTLMNAITRQETSIVDATPGTTAGEVFGSRQILSVQSGTNRRLLMAAHQLWMQRRAPLQVRCWACRHMQRVVF
jgi:hypothetical protein